MLLIAASAFAADPDGTTPLHWAVRDGDSAQVQSLLRAGADPNAANLNGVTPLSLAASDANTAMIAMLLKAGANAKPANIVMTAARTGNADAVKLLLAAGADPNASESTYGETALMWAAAENHAAAAQALVERGANINARSKELEFPKDRFGLEGVTTVLPRGSWTALMYAARQGSTDAAQALAAAGANLNLTDPDGTTALVLAIINGHYDTAAMLAEAGADPNIADSTGMAALYAAVDMNTLGEVYGQPPRHFSNRLSAVDLMKVLIDNGADLNARLKSPTLYRAHTPGEGSLGEGTTPLMRAAKNGDAAGMRMLLGHGADPSAAQKNHTTALMFAAGLGRGTGVFAKDYATETELAEAVRILLDHGVDVNAANNNGQTALHFAVLASDEIVKILAAHGAKLDAKDKDGHTPLDTAMAIGVRPRVTGPVPPRPATAALLRELMAAKP